jgi:hypothetical protein
MRNFRLSSMIGVVLGSVFLFSFSAFGQDPERTREDVNREVVLTYSKVYLEQRDFERAEQVILDYISSENDRDGRVLFQLGEVQLEQKKFSDACNSYQSAVSVLKGSDQIYAQYGLANCYFRGGRPDDAKRLLNRIAKEAAAHTNTVDQAIAWIKAGQVRPGDSLPPYRTRTRGESFRMASSLLTGYDTNVLLVEDDVAAGASSADIASPFVNPSLFAAYQTRLFGRQLEARTYHTYTHYTNTAVNSFNSLYSRFDLAFGSGSVRWTLFGDAFLLNRPTFGVYSWEGGLMWSLFREDQSSRTTLIEVPLQYQKFILPEGTDAINDRTGADLKVRFYRRWFRNSGENVMLGAMLDLQYSNGANYRMAGFSFPATGAVSLPLFRSLGLLNTFGLELRGQYFPESDSGRRDLWGRFSTGLSRQIGSRWSLSVEFSGQKNISTVAAARYTKNLVFMQLSAQIF